MARPNSKTTRIRNWLVKLIEAHPDMGEAWCVNCKLNAGNTQILPQNSIKHHVRQHYRLDYVVIRTCKMRGPE